MGDNTTPCSKCSQGGPFEYFLIADREPGKRCPDFELDPRRNTKKTRGKAKKT